jgi:GT2 family glycosyltransferase
MDVVIVNWNTGDCLHNCLSSLSVAGAGISVGRSVVVDNASSDGSIEHLPDLPHLVVVRNSQNVGFAAACNQGARLGSAPYVLFLNPDTLLLPDTLRSVLAFMESPDGTPYGICGGSVLQADGTPGLSASRFPTLANVVMSTPRLERLVPSWVPPRHMAANELAASQPVDQVIGAFFVVRRSLFDRLEGFDERYFLYYEEVDFCYRAASVGASTYLLSDAKLYHIGNVSAKRSGGLALFQSVRSRTVYAIRHWARRDVFALVAFTLMLELPARVLRAMFRFDASETAAVGRAFGHYLAFILRTVRHRGLIPDMPPNGSHAAARSGRVGVLGGSMTRTSNSSTQGRISRLPFARPTIGEDEIAEVVSALRSGWITTGPRTKLFEEQFGAEVGADAALALSSGTAAMHLALVAMDIGPGHRVFTSPMTFCSTAHVIEHVGAPQCSWMSSRKHSTSIQLRFQLPSRSPQPNGQQLSCRCITAAIPAT